MANTIKPTIQQSQVNDMDLQNAHYSNINAFNKLSDRPPFDGTLDKNADVRLRLAVVDNPENSKGQGNLLDITSVFNMNNGQLVLRWLDTAGGAIRPKELDGQWTYNKKNAKYNPEDREFNEWNITSSREMVPLTHPFIWTSSNNWAGFNYIPPIGSVVVVGFKKQGFPVILGYIQQHFKVCYPVLEPGEISVKGYGNNYAHFRWSDKLDLKAWSVENEKDIDDPTTPESWRDSNSVGKVNPTNCTLWIRLNANDRKIEISAFEQNKDTSATSDGGAKDPVHETHVTNVTIKPKSLTITSAEISDSYSPGHIQSRNTQYYQDEDCVQLVANNPLKNLSTKIYQNASTIIHSATVQGNGSTTVQTPGSYQINADSFSVNSKTINITSTGSTTIKGSTINLNP